MSADVIEQLRMLGELLDAHAAPVTLHDIRRIELHEALELESATLIDTHAPVPGRPTSAPRTRRLAVAALAVAAMLVGLIVIARRDAGESVPASDVSSIDPGPPAWYDLIAPSLPEEFRFVAFTHATESQLFFVAINPIDGKTLEISLTHGVLDSALTTTVDATGAWVDVPMGLAVGTPANLVVEVVCDIGLGGRYGRNYNGTTNYCDTTDGVSPFTKDEIRAVAISLATSLTVSIFDQDLGRPSGDPIDIARATALIAEAIPGQPIDASDTGYAADHIYNIGATVDPESPSLTVPFDAVGLPAGTSVRILRGVLPEATVNAEPVASLYGDAAVVSMFGSGGVYVRISTTDPSPESVTRLAQLARDLIRLDPTTGSTGSPTINTVQATTTTVTPASAATTPAGETTTTLTPCAETGSAALTVVVNASHIDGAATWWRASLLASNPPGIALADPSVGPVAEAVAMAPTSRVLALEGFECPASLVAHLTTGAAVESATRETLQALVTKPLPAAASIVLLIGDDRLSTAATYATPTTTTVSGPTTTTTTTIAMRCGEGHYTVIDGDHLVLIASKFDTTVDAILAANGWSDAHEAVIFPGQEIVVPTAAAPSCAGAS
jgi:LysM repeat protein